MLINIFHLITRIYLLANILWISLISSQPAEEVQWEQNGNYSYLFIDPTYTAHLTWYEAEAKCRNQDALLVSIGNKEENTFITSKISAGELYWIGLSALNIWDDYRWLDGTRLVYENWDSKSNHDNRITREKCVKFQSESGKWQDSSCGEWAGTICKKSNLEKKDFPPFPISPPEGNCPSEWIQFDKKCYKIFEKPENWTIAKEQCRAIDTNHDLISIHSTAENMFLTSILTNDTWIGGGRLKNENRLGWSDNSPFDYDQFQKKTSVWKNKCVQMSAYEHTAGIWEPILCSEKKMYVCQRYLDPLISESHIVIPPKCVNDKQTFVEYNNDCYLTLKEVKTWTEAEKFCEGFGAHLVSIGNVFESAFIYSYLYPLSNDVWIGLLGEGGLFKWFDTWPVYYSNWMKGHPKYLSSNQTQCVALDKETQQWKIKDCESKNAALCKLSDVEPPEIEEFEGDCPSYIKEGLDLGGRYCYSIYDSGRKADWATAAKTCLKYKSKLASFHSEHEIKVLRPYLNNMKDVWIGLHQIHDETYEWVDESALDFVYWKEGVTPKGECVTLGLPSLNWQGADCKLQKPFICAAPKIERAKNKESKSGRRRLSPSAIAGIVITVLIVLPGLSYFAYYLWKNKVFKRY